ncbi:MAG: hypothetical protein COW71_13520 [Ignavibacteriales bacterium CG18_big_fil_WC_8_21_14_2_50_31_20]|nr:MAG: hypothetical protein COW71_13520 [Ignavibacteriales bacterium CG18_big_fil_WC_8_21_14_2_50_31_20]
MRKHYRNIFAVLLSFVFFTVFINKNDLVDSLTAKTFYFYFISIIVFTFVILKLFAEKRELTISLNKLDVLILVYYSYNFVRLIFTEYVPINNEKFINLTLLLGYYFIFKTIFKNGDIKNNTKIILLISFLSVGFGQCLIGLFQFYNIFGFNSNYYRVIGSFSVMATYSGFVVSILPFAFGLFVLIKDKATENIILKHLGKIAFISGLFILPIIRIRGDWLAIIGGVIFILIYKYNIIRKLNLIFSSKVKKTALFVSIISLAFLIIIGLYNMRPASAFGRILMWKVAANIITDYPIFGAGFDRFGDIYNNYQADYFIEKTRDPYEIYVADNVNYAHNDFLEIFAELGIIGLFSFVLIIISAIWDTKTNNEAYENNNILAKSAKASIIGIVISSQFTFSFQILPTLLNFVFLLSIISAIDKHNKFITFSIKPAYLKIISLISAVLIFLFSLNTINSYKANINWQKAKIYSQLKMYDKAINFYSYSYNILKNNGDFLLNYGGTLSLFGRDKEAITILEKAKNLNSSNNLYVLLGNSYSAINNYENSEKAYTKAINIIPNRLYPKYMLVKMYVKNNKRDKAKNLALQIINSKAKVTSLAEKEIKKEMQELLN